MSTAVPHSRLTQNQLDYLKCYLKCTNFLEKPLGKKNRKSKIENRKSTIRKKNIGDKYRTSCAQYTLIYNLQWSSARTIALDSHLRSPNPDVIRPQVSERRHVAAFLQRNRYLVCHQPVVRILQPFFLLLLCSIVCADPCRRRRGRHDRMTGHHVSGSGQNTWTTSWCWHGKLVLRL